jgi:hypothetical protein
VLCTRGAVAGGGYPNRSGAPQCCFAPSRPTGPRPVQLGHPLMGDDFTPSFAIAETWISLSRIKPGRARVTVVIGPSTPPAGNRCVL